MEILRLHTQSDFYVCSMCGSIRECVHDEDEDGQLGNPRASNSATVYVAAAARQKHGKTHVTDIREMDDCYEMVSCAPIVPGSEVYNTYGDKLGNGQLLVHYGFLLEGNEHDRITFDSEDLDGLVRSPEERRRVAELWNRANEEWSHGLRQWLTKDSRLVYSEACDDGLDRGRQQSNSHREGSSIFRVNGDGKITDGLWLYCSLVSLDKIGVTRIEEAMKLLGNMVDWQIVAEKEMEIWMADDDEEEDGGALLFGIGRDDGGRGRQRAPQREENQPDYDERPSSSSPTTMATMMQAVASLCEAKIGQLGKPGADLTKLGDVADVSAATRLLP